MEARESARVMEFEGEKRKEITSYILYTKQIYSKQYRPLILHFHGQIKLSILSDISNFFYVNFIRICVATW